MKNAIILAAGKSTRFNGNKLFQKFSDKTLLEYAFLFCLRNKIENIFVTVSDFEVLTKSNFGIYKKLFKKAEFAFQDKDLYGPAAAIMPWVDKVSDDFLVLLADNFIWGSIDGISDILNCYNNSCVIGSIFKEDSKENLRLAYIEPDYNKVIEKPHNYTEGNYFGGFCAFQKRSLKDLKNLKPSIERNEYEITHLINLNEKIFTFDLKQLSWKDLTYYHEIIELDKFIYSTLC